MKRLVTWFLVTAVLVTLVTLTGCRPEKPTAAPPRIRLADQFGLGYAPLTIMLEKKFLEKHLPGIVIERKKFGSGGAVREAVIAGDLDVGFMGIPPFLVGWDKGVDWKIAGALDSMPLLLLTYREELKSIQDLGPQDKVALPGPGSNQHILLAMAAEKELENARALDDIIVAMPHPDAATALLSRQDVTCYYGAPPYQYELLKQPGIREIGDGFSAFGGEFSYIVAVAAGRFYREQPQTYQAFCAALEDSLEFIRTQPTAAAE
ncbi:MAG TPA: ABC transporter substrate-binding protein, partial [Firmicutes bacterium]|nr:ABC transporter substrate-binding protein [Bacillota bacterium]